MDCVVFRLLNLTKISSSMYQLLLELVQYLPKHILRELTVFNLGRTYPSYYNAALSKSWGKIESKSTQWCSRQKKKEAWAVLCRNGINIISFFLDKRLIFFAFLTYGVFELQVYPQSTKFRFPRESAMLGVYDKSVWAWEKKLMWIFHSKRLMCIRCWQRFNNLLILWRMRPMKRER